MLSTAFCIVVRKETCVMKAVGEGGRAIEVSMSHG
jgi:hypothetical protein